MKKNNKGFTLIELLVVVAIIGILAAVGTVAYQGYIAGANKSATKSNHASAVKYIAAELAKCSIGESEVFKDKDDGTLNCGARTDGEDEVAKQAKKAMSDFKNAYDTTAETGTLVGEATLAESDDGLGFTYITDDGSTVDIATCYVTPCSTEANVMSNTVSIE